MEKETDMEVKPHFVYGEKEIAFLKTKDPVLGGIMDEVGHVRREIIPDMFMALVNSIIGQQISTKAQITVWERFCSMFAPVTPETIHAIPVETIQTCGISMRKAAYIKEIAGSVVGGSLDLDHLHALDDEAVGARLSGIKGIGVWTAEMLMIFSMQRPDILSWDDLAIHRGLRMLYRHRKITPELFVKYKRRYSPYASIASLYLWEIAGGACAGLADCAPKTAARKKADARKRGKKARAEKKAAA